MTRIRTDTQIIKSATPGSVLISNAQNEVIFVAPGTVGTVLTVGVTGLPIFAQVVNNILTTITNTVAGHKIADYTNENGVVVSINETNTTLDGVMLTAANVLSIQYTGETGVAQTRTVSLASLAVNTSIQSVVYSTGTNSWVITQSDGSTFPISWNDMITDGDFCTAVKGCETNTTVTGTISGHIIATITNEDGAIVNINETVTNFSQPTANTLSYINENSVSQGAVIIASNGLSLNASNDIISSVNGISSTPLDLSNVIKAEETTTVITNTVAGHKIADYTNEDGVVVAINEVVTSLNSVVLSTSNILTVSYTGENNVIQTRTVDLTALAIDINVASLSYNPLSGVITLTETDGAVHTIDIGPFSETVTTVTNTVTGHKIADHTSENGTITAINEVVTNFTQPTANALSYVNENGTTQAATIIASNALSSNGANDLISTINGIASVPFDLSNIIKAEETTTVISNTISGHKIADYSNEDTVVVTINETVTTVDSLAVNGANLELKSTNENGVQSTVSVPTANLCAACAACIEMGNTLSYTLASRPVTGTPGQIVFISDSGAGILQFWQPSSNSWVNV